LGLSPYCPDVPTPYSPLCPIIRFKLRKALSLYQISRWPLDLKSICPLVPRVEPRYSILFIQKVPASESPPCSLKGLLWREIPAYRTFLRLSFNISLFIFSSKSPVASPLHVPQQSSHGQGYSVTRATGLFIYLFIHSFFHSFIHVCLPESPKRSPCTYAQNIMSPSTEPHADGRPTYSVVRPGFQRRSLTLILLMWRKE
jgi:hypothetical protein